jgi:histidinol-phosphatase
MGSEMDVQAELSFAFGLADLAAGVSLPRCSERAFAVATKPDGSPVTDVDHEVEQLLRARIHARRPEDLILGEEAGESGPSRSRWRWYLDPIDGTKRYVGGSEVDDVDRARA